MFGLRRLWTLTFSWHRCRWTACSEDSKNARSQTSCAHTLLEGATQRAAVRLNIMATIVGIVDSLAALENAVCVSVIVAHCLCVLLCRAEKSMLINTTQLQSLYWPLQSPGILGTIKTSQLQLLAAFPPPPHPSPLCCFSPLPLLSLLKQRDKARPPMTVILGLAILL